MKFRLFAAAVAMVAAMGQMSAATDTFVNLTPKPKTMTVADGELALPQSFVISHSALPEAMQAEVGKFAASFSAATGMSFLCFDVLPQKII